MFKEDALDNQDMYGNGDYGYGFDGSRVVDADIYTEINNDFGNTKWKENVGDDGLPNWMPHQKIWLYKKELMI